MHNGKQMMTDSERQRLRDEAIADMLESEMERLGMDDPETRFAAMLRVLGPFITESVKNPCQILTDVNRSVIDTMIDSEQMPAGDVGFQLGSAATTAILGCFGDGEDHQRNINLQMASEQLAELAHAPSYGSN